MSENIIYPKNINDLFQKLEFKMINEENEDKIKDIQKWIEWYKKINIQLNYKCKKNEFFQAYYDNQKYSLQLWIHDDIVDSCLKDLIANHYSDFYAEETIITED